MPNIISDVALDAATVQTLERLPGVAVRLLPPPDFSQRRRQTRATPGHHCSTSNSLLILPSGTAPAAQFWSC